MNSRQIELIRSTFVQVESIADQATALFYERLFELDPALRPMFSVRTSADGTRLMRTVKSAVNLLDRPYALVSAMEALGRRHLAGGVKDEHYVTIGAALLWTLERGLGHAFTPDVKNAWLTFYLLTANTMKAAIARYNATVEADEPDAVACLN
ncbi:MAG TPA: globin family protein [Verrucomicrobiae bacterium]|nr:globin family protein [Verrucomicrobiae bacterium]